MDRFRNLLLILFTKKFFKKTLAYLFIILLIYFLRDFLGFFLLVFIFSFLFFTFGKYLKEKFDLFIDNYCGYEKRKKIIKKLFNLNFFIILEYLFLIGIIVFILSDLLPRLISELSELNNKIPFITEEINKVTNTLEELKNFNSKLGLTVTQLIESKDYQVILNILKQVKTAGIYFFQFILSLLLSFVFIIDRKKLSKYLYGIKKSSFSFLYKEYSIIFEKILKSFGLIIKAQSMIALINAILTVIGLIIIGFIHGVSFPFLLTLGLLVFICGFIPVLGVFISSIPIIFIAFSFIGGYTIIFEIIILIFIIHIIEAYYLNPKIVSRFFELPVSLTFLILIVSEHLFGIAGLLIGVSVFYFFIGLLIDIDNMITKKHKEIKKQKILKT